MAKCRLLYQENEELGKMTTNGRLAKLEGDLALQKSFSEEVKKSQSGEYSQKTIACTFTHRSTTSILILDFVLFSCHLRAR